MKYLIIILIFLSSCGTPELLPEIRPEYQIPPPPEQAHPSNQIVIVQPPEDTRVITEHSFAMLIDKTFTFLSTALAIFFIDQSQ